MAQTVYFYTDRKPKGEKRWQGPGVIIARYGNQYDLVHFMGSYLEVALGDLKSTDKVLDVFSLRRRATVTCGKYKIPITLSSRFANVDFLI